ncbi:MAG TPA: hypothetical protein QF509_00355 [Rhodospirillales bacterium]|jgi:hypothetical protein|nr:hypothetical protein [Rhodospirillales bacterium]
MSAIVIGKEMGIDRSEFVRVMARTYGGEGFSMDGGRAVIATGTRRMEVVHEESPRRRLGPLAMPAARVTLTFTGYGEAEAEIALAHFERRFLRAGG